MKALVKMGDSTMKLHYFIVENGETYTCDKYVNVKAGEGDDYLVGLVKRLESSTGARTFIKDESLRYYSSARLVMLQVTIFEKVEDGEDEMYFLRPSIKTGDNGYVAIKYGEDLGL